MSIGAYGVGPAALAAMWGLRSAGLIADEPFWLYALLIGGSSAANVATAALVRTHHEQALAIHARVATSTITTAVTLYAVGWGPVLIIAYALGSAELLRTVGVKATRPNLLWTVIAIAAGQLAIAAGWAPSLLPPTLSHAIAVTGSVLLAAVTRTLSESAGIREAAEDHERERAGHFEALVAHARDLIGVIAPDGTIEAVSPAVTPMLGYKVDAVVGRDVAEYLEPETASLMASTIAHAASHIGKVMVHEIELRHADGGRRLVEVTFTCPGESWNGSVVLNVHDVTTQRALESQLRHDARHDALTGLLNRKALGEISAIACDEATAAGGAVGMLYIDLDGFKDVNDTYGHDSGDRVLCETARRISGCLGSGETLARLGGDEFAVLVTQPSPGRPASLADRILEELSIPHPGFPTEVRVGASIGIAVRNREGIEMSTLLHAADAAMYSAKRAGRRRWVMDESAVEV